MHFNAQPIEADIVHCHTWYSMWGGILARLGYGIPLVATVHSLLDSVLREIDGEWVLD